MTELRLEANVIVKDKRLVAALKAATNYHLLAETQELDAADEALGVALAAAREAAAEGGELVRVQHVPETWTDDGEPASWTVDVVGRYERGC